MKTAIKVTKVGRDFVMTFGRYKGRTVEELLDEDPNYLTWAHTNVSWVKLEQDMLDEAIEKYTNDRYDDLGSDYGLGYDPPY